MKKLLLSTCLLIMVLSCKESNSVKKENPSTVETEELNSQENEGNSKTITDNFVGKWKNISVPDEIVEITQKYDNVYQFGTLEVFKEYAEDGTVYLQGTFDNQIEFQLIFDNHTQHLIVRHPFDTREYSKIQ